MPRPIRTLLVTGADESGRSVAESLARTSDEHEVVVESTGAAARARLDGNGFDCVASRYHLPEADGVTLLESVREQRPELPFVLYTDAGSETVAADAITAGVSEYVRWDEQPVERLANAIRTAVADARRVGDAEASEQRLEQTLKTVPSCVVELDADGRFVYANDRAEDVLGLERTAVTDRGYADPGWDIRDLDGEQIPDAELPFRQVVDSEAPIRDYRHSIQWPDGSRKILSVSGRPLFNDDGVVERVVFSLQDVTDRHRRQVELGRYEKIVEHLDDVATIIDEDGVIRYVSPAVERVLGYEPDELVGQDGFSYQPPETTEQVAAGIEAVLSNPDTTHTVRTKFRHADGSYRWMESTLQNRLDDDVIDGVLVSSREVTTRVNQTETLRERERQLEELHEATRELLSSETPHEVAATASRTAVDILDQPMNGVHFYDDDVDGLRPVAIAEGTRQAIDEVPVLDEGLAWDAFQDGAVRVYQDLTDVDDTFDADSPIRSELYMPLLDRGVFIISSTDADAFAESDVEFARLLAANTSAALERVDAEQRLRAREAELEQQNERLEEFASIVSHDLRNPLNVAKARSTLVADEYDGEHMAYVQQSLDRMEDIVMDTLTLARQGKLVAETEPISLATLVQQGWASVSSDDATVELDDDATIRGDQSRLQHVFENLFRNSVEHSSTSNRTRSGDSVEDGGSDVRISVGRIGDDGFYVEDTGPGIPEDRRQEVFDPGETSNPDGTGFGLAIVKRIAIAHGWDVRVVSGSDGGARFEFTDVDLDSA
jgi:PAS domain S-box-containing protein